MRYPLSSFFLRADVAHRSKAAHIARSSPHQVVGIHHTKRFDVDEILYQYCVKKLLVGYLVRQVAERLGEPDGIIAFDPSSFPKRGTHSVGVKRQWCGHRGKVDNCQVGVFMGYVSAHDHALLDFRLSLPQEWARDEQRRQACHVPPEVQYHKPRHDLLYASASFRRLDCSQSKPALSTGHQWLKMLSCTTPCSVLGYR